MAALPYITGKNVKYSLIATPNSVAPFLTTIAGASYGDDTTDVTVDPSGQSVTIKVVSGVDNLVITVVSPNQNDAAALVEGATQRFVFDLTEHWDGCKLEISGTP
jgi:hypothetical protein